MSTDIAELITEMRFSANYNPGSCTHSRCNVHRLKAADALEAMQEERDQYAESLALSVGDELEQIDAATLIDR